MYSSRADQVYLWARSPDWDIDIRGFLNESWGIPKSPQLFQYENGILLDDLGYHPILLNLLYNNPAEKIDKFNEYHWYHYFRIGFYFTLLGVAINEISWLLAAEGHDVRHGVPFQEQSSQQPKTLGHSQATCARTKEGYREDFQGGYGMFISWWIGV